MWLDGYLDWLKEERLKTVPAQPPKTLRVRISPAAESKVRQGHPWIFADSIRSLNRDGTMGELAVVFDRSDRFMAVGLFDPESPLRIRVLHRGKARAVDPAWWKDHLAEAVARRAGVADGRTNGLRWINGESDGWPGLVLDQYGGTLVAKLYSAAWFPWLEAMAELFRSQFKPERIVLRLSRNIQSWASLHDFPKDGAVLFGPAVPGPVVFSESGILFLADVIQGQKTGFFLDQRENRRRAEGLAKGAEVLNLFSFSGGFSLYAARGGARSVTSVDISEHALRELRLNWDLNKEVPPIRDCPHDEVRADVFEWLDSQKKKYDLIVIDPPSLAKREKDREGAIRAYRRLAAAGLERLKKGGCLVCASCSAHVSEPDFLEAVRSAVRDCRRTAEEMEVTGHAPDHPATLPEMRYLKAIYLRDPG